ncbi:MAG TPA: LON peptidase substrate-binding domain-containing protein [Armatimonadota bacterium]|nr:LON peptidase substrate-binding domain-containing protein [Armatimonadota bacterium]
MPAVSGEIPLLPLPTVLFPGTFLPLQITDESQRAMLRACVDEGNSLGVVLTSDDDLHAKSAIPYTTGCLASVALLAYENDDFSDEPISVVLYGEHRIRIIEYVQQDPYLTGQVESFKDYDGLNVERRAQQTSQRFDQYLDIVREYYSADVINFSLPSDPTLASYVLASVLYLPLSIKQRWLESPSTAYRLEQELAYLQAECEKHEVLLSLSRQMHRRYSFPDPQLYLSLTSNN